MKIRIGNDFVFNWAIERGGLPENLSSVLEKHLHLSVFGKRVELVEDVDYDITGNVIRIEVTPAIANIIGTYKAEFHYILPDNGLIDEDRKCAVDVDAFKIVAKTAQADDSTEFSVTSDMAIAFKGDKGDSAYQVWLDAGNIGTEEDYFAYLQKPATDAIGIIQAVEQTVSENESLRITSETNRKDAEDLRLSAEILRKENETERGSKESVRIENESERVSKESIRNENEATRVENEELRQSAETSRNTAEGERQTNTATAILQANAARDLANEKAGLAATATTEANTAAQTANEAADNANEKANLANTAAQNADNARDNIMPSVLNNEEVQAETYNDLNARITALEAIITNKIKDRIDVTKEFNVWGKTNLILYGAGANTKEPDFIGQKYIDTAGGNVYVAVGIASAGNWKLV